MKVFYQLAALFVVLFQTMDLTKGQGMVTANLSLGINTTNGSIGGGESAGNTTGDDPVIIGGTVATTRKSFPWMVYLQCTYGTSRWSCGGSLISSKHVLTAAHCVTYESGLSILKATQCTTVIGGLTSNFDGDVSGEVQGSASSTNIKYHEGYAGSSSTTNDLAVVRFSPAVSPSAGSNINIITLASTDYQGQPVTIVGWGVTDSGTTSSVLMRANTLLQTNSVCQAAWNCPGFQIQYDANTHSCYGGSGVNGVCSGDSGGPVVYGTGDAAVQIAINSFVRAGFGPAVCPESPRTTVTPRAPEITRATVPTRTTERPRSGFKSFLNSLMALMIAPTEPLRRWKRSAGTDLCRIDVPAVGAKVAAYRTWITNAMNQLA